MSENTSKQLEKVDLKVIERMLFSLIQDGSERKTVLARKTNLNYDYFIRYLEFLELIDLIKRETRNRDEVISVSDLGRSFYTRRFSEKNNSQTN